MQGKTILLDANLLILLAVGLASTTYIQSHKRLSRYTIRDYELLQQMLAAAKAVIVTTNAMTEADNLAVYINEPARTRVREVFRRIIENVSEKHIPSRTAVLSPAYSRLGLADAGMLDQELSGCILLTDDFRLYDEASRRGMHAVNFNHYIEAAR